MDEMCSDWISALQLQLLKSNPDLLAIASPQARFLWVSQSWTTTLGWSEQELQGTPFLEFVVESDRTRTLAEFECMMREGRDAVQFWNCTASRPSRIMHSNSASVRVRSDSTTNSRKGCLLYTSPSPRDGLLSRMPSSA